MFCPLCKAEYRQGFSQCSTCSATLLPDDAPESDRDPPLRVWVTHNDKSSDRVFALLREAGIPCFQTAHAEHWVNVVIRRRPEFTLHIFERDAAAAQGATGIEFQLPLQKPRPTQICPLCRARFEVGRDTCPECNADLLVWRTSAGSASENGGSAAEPLATCPEDDDAPELVWRGSDPVIYSRAIGALREADIQHIPAPNFDHMAFQLAIPRPRWEIRVAHAAAARAHELLSEFQDPFPLVPQEPPPAISEEADDSQPPAVSAAEVASMDASSAEYQRRRNSLRWGLGLLWLSILLAYWVMRPSMMGIYSRSQVSSLRLLALQFLAVTAIICATVACFALLRAWAWRLDKLGLLACFFGLQGMIVVTYLMIALFQTPSPLASPQHPL